MYIGEYFNCIRCTHVLTHLADTIAGMTKHKLGRKHYIKNIIAVTMLNTSAHFAMGRHVFSG